MWSPPVVLGNFPVIFFPSLEYQSTGIGMTEHISFHTKWTNTAPQTVPLGRISHYSLSGPPQVGLRCSSYSHPNDATLPYTYICSPRRALFPPLLNVYSGLTMGLKGALRIMC